MSAPLLTAALPGFRAWMVDAAGHLLPYTGQAGAWEPGENTATCAHGACHVAPDPACTCGLYAFHAMHPQLRGEPVVGAIAAWGDMEVYRDGFRAQHARVIALCGTGARVRAAGARYAVPVVPRRSLLALGTIATGALPGSLIEGPDESWFSRRRGYVDQTWVEASAGVVTVGVSPQAAEAGAVELPGTVRGTVIERNAEVTSRDPWVVRLLPSHWEEDCQAFHWGPAGREEMLLEVERSGADAWGHLMPGAPEGPRSWREVRELMAEWRAQEPPPRFDSAEEVYDELAIPLGQALARDASRLDVVLGFTLERPSARLVIDFRRGQLHTGRGPTPEIEATLSADDLLALIEGRFDLARESRTGRLRLRGSLAHALSSLAVFGAWARPHAGSPRRP